MIDDLQRILKISSLITLAIIFVERIIFWDSDIQWVQEVENGVITFLIALVLTVINIYYNRYIADRYSWEEQPQKRIVIGSLGSIFVSILAYAILRVAMMVGYYNKSFDVFLQNETKFTYLIFLIVSLVISLFIHAFYFYKALQERKVKEQKIIAGTASAKFDALKNQLDPHFLFNSLNVLTSLIEEDPSQAQKFTTSLSKVYRYVLEQKNKDLVSVDEELQFARTYVRLLKMRFEDSIIFDIPEKSANPNAKIVPLSLQLLLENAVKHNVVTADRPLHIKVCEVENTLVVSNNLQEKQVLNKSSGVGLQNIQLRYKILTDRKVSIQKKESEFIVQLPMLTQQISAVETQRVYIDDKYYKKAKQKVERIKKFYGNLLAYCVVIPFLVFLNYQSTGFPWVIFPIVGWGIGVIIHGMEAYEFNPFLGKGWEERRIKKYMDDDKF